MASETSSSAAGERTETGISLYDVDEAFQRMENWPSENLDILEGHPENHRGAIIYRDPSRQLSVGVWECPPGKFRLVEDDATVEHCMMGKARLTNLTTGESITVTPGMKWVVKPGTEMIWEILEHFRKEYIVFGEWNEDRYW